MCFGKLVVETGGGGGEGLAGMRKSSVWAASQSLLIKSFAHPTELLLVLLMLFRKQLV